MLDKADDVQDDEVNLVWTVADDADPTNSPSMLLSNNLVSQDLLITPDHDQFGAYTFHFEVEDSHGLTDSETIVFTVVNVNDAPIICNTERADCMPVFSDDGAGNLNVLDEGFGSVSKALGSAANATGSYIIDMASNDMANEQPQVYNWAAKIKSDNVTVEPYWVQKKYATVPAMFAEVGAVMTASWWMARHCNVWRPNQHHAKWYICSTNIERCNNSDLLIGSEWLWICMVPGIHGFIR